MAEIIWENIIEEQNDSSELETIQQFEIKNDVPIEQVYLHQKPGFVDIGNGILKYDDLLNPQDYTYFNVNLLMKNLGLVTVYLKLQNYTQEFQNHLLSKH